MLSSAVSNNKKAEPLLRDPALFNIYQSKLLDIRMLVQLPPCICQG